MLTWAIIFLIIAVLAGVFGLMVAGPIGPIAFLVFLGLFIWSAFMHFREQDRKAQTRFKARVRR